MSFLHAVYWISEKDSCLAKTLCFYLENAKLAILEQLELQIFFAPFQSWWREGRQILKFSTGSLGTLEKPKGHLWTIPPHIKAFDKKKKNKA